MKARGAIVPALQLLLTAAAASACPHEPHAVLRARKHRDGGTVRAARRGRRERTWKCTPSA